MIPAADAASFAPGLYVHIPFCSSICPYCDFAVTRGGAARQVAFAAALRVEIATASAQLGKRFTAPFDTVYFGGGTPSALAPEVLGGLIEALRAALPITPEARILVEANPEDVTPSAAAQWRALGIHGVSLGVQSFRDEELRFLGRRHDAAQARRAVETVHGASLPWTSLDLIYGLPGQKLSHWEENLSAALGLGTPHLSCYQLTLHAGTPFARRAARGRLTPVGEDAEASFFQFTHEFLAAAGLPGYEVSNFAQGPAQRSAHNPKYWAHAPYLGLGPSAHSFDGHRRWWNERDLASYQKRLAAGELPVAGEEQLTAAQLALEEVMLRLRTTDGLDLAGYAERHGHDLQVAAASILARWRESGFALVEAGQLRLTLRGLSVVDALVAQLPEPAGRAGPDIAAML